MKITVRKNQHATFMVDGELGTNSYALGPLEMFSPRCQVVRETIAYAAENDGKGMYWGGALGPLSYKLAILLADKVSEQESPQTVSQTSEPYGHSGYHYKPVTVIDARAGELVCVYNAECWQALRERAESVTLDNATGVRRGLAVFYNKGAVVGLLMPMIAAPEKLEVQGDA